MTKKQEKLLNEAYSLIEHECSYEKYDEEEPENYNDWDDRKDEWIIGGKKDI